MASSTDEKSAPDVSAVTVRQPAVFVNHGAGPLPYLYHIGNKGSHAKFQFPDESQVKIIESCQLLGSLIQEYKPKALCVISAHWEAAQPTVLYSETPSRPLLFDYYGFPEESYKIQYSAPYDNALADQIVKLFKNAGHKQVVLEKQRGYDHGVFIPLSIAWPKADVPLVQIALRSVTADKTETARSNLELGAMLSKLRDEGVMIIGSGLSYHNMGGFMQPSSAKTSQVFDAWLVETVSKKPLNQSVLEMAQWHQAPNALQCHPREEHLLPLHVCLGSNMKLEQMQQLFAAYDKDAKSVNIGDAKPIKVQVTKLIQGYAAASGFVFS